MVKFLEHYFEAQPQIKSKLRLLKFRLNDLNLRFWSDNGIFAKRKIDYGSRLLITTFIKQNSNRVLNLLDVGCGYGVIGITLAKFYHCSAHLIDINERAVGLAKRNARVNKVIAQAWISDCYNQVTAKYPIIVTNPPIRAGKSIVEKILNQARFYLTPAGELWYVMRKDKGALRFKSALESNYQVEIMEQKKGFCVIKAKNN